MAQDQERDAQHRDDAVAQATPERVGSEAKKQHACQKRGEPPTRTGLENGESQQGDEGGHERQAPIMLSPDS